MSTPLISSGGSGPMGAVELVNDAWDKFDLRAETWIARTNDALAGLGSLTLEPVSFSVNYNPETFFPQFTRPERPTLPTLRSVTFTAPTAPVLDAVQLRELGDAPAEPDLSGLVYVPPAPPSAPMPTAPTDLLPELDAIAIPERPAYVLPDVPTLFDLNLPDLPTITLPAFDGVRPEFEIALPEDGTLAYAEIQYNPVLQADMTTALRRMLQGEHGLPIAIERAIFDRGRARQEQQTRKRIMEAAEDMGARNLVEPSGILAARLREIRAEGAAAVTTLNTELTIKTEEQALEGVRFAIGQALALEQMLITQNLAINDRALRIALEGRNYAIARLNALVAYHNLELQAYETDARVWQQRMAGELAKLDVFKAEIQAQQLVGEINRDLVARYEAQLRGVLAMAEFYKTDVDAARTKGEINVQRIQSAKLRIDAYTAQVDGWSKQFDGYRSQVEASLGTVKFTEALAQVHATRMQGYKIKGDAYFQEARLGIERNGQTLDLFRANLAAAEQDVRGQLAELDAQVRGFGAAATLYQADGALAEAESAAYDRTARLKIESERNRVDTELKQAESRIQQMLKIGEVMVEQLKARAAALAQLVASSQSGVNFGASISAGQSVGYSYGKSFGYSGDTPDSSPMF